MKNRLRKFFIYQWYECDVLKRYLEEMALKGWQLDYIHTFLYFKKIEPKKIIYSVETFLDSSIYSMRPEGKVKEYINYCEEAGWKYVCIAGRLVIFMSDKDDIIPIETDENLKYESIKKIFIKQNLFSWIFPINGYYIHVSSTFLFFR